MSEAKYHFLRDNKPGGPVSLQALVAAVNQKQLRAGDYVKRDGDDGWTAVENARWLHEAAQAQREYERDEKVRAEAERALGVTATSTPPAKSRGRGRTKWLVAGLCLLLLGLAGTLVFVTVGRGPEQQAQAYLTGELDDWRSGRLSDAVYAPEIRSVDALVSYEVLRVEPVTDLEYDEELAFAFTVQLTFNTVAGGELNPIHHFRVYRSKKEGRWKVQPLTAYM